MKKLLTLILVTIASVGLFVSCGDDPIESPDSPNPTPSIVGTWIDDTNTSYRTGYWKFGEQGDFESHLYQESLGDQPRYGRYYLVNGELTIKIQKVAGNNNAYTDVYTVRTLTDKKLVLVGSDVKTFTRKAENQTDKEFQQIVNTKVSGSARYSDYGWNISINTLLAGALPGKNVKYGMECGYSTYDFLQYFEFTGTSFTTTESIFIGQIYPEERFDYTSYMKLKQKLDSGKTLSSDERDLYNILVNEFKQALNKGANKYQARLFAEINGARYYFYSFKY